MEMLLTCLVNADLPIFSNFLTAQNSLHLKWYALFDTALNLTFIFLVPVTIYVKYYSSHALL